MALIVKRFCEEPKRPWKVWCLDTSKQAFSALLAHTMNMILAMLLSDEGLSEADNCDWYFVSLLVDVCIGILFCYIILKTIEAFAAYKGIEVLNTGVYVHEDYSSINHT
jgi:hypothetical protein